MSNKQTQKEMETKTKKAIKAESDLKIQLSNSLNRRLIDFKNLYLQSSVDHNLRNINSRLNQLKKVIAPTPNDLFAIEQLEKRIDRSALESLPILVEADKSFNLKLSNLVSKCIEFGIESRFMKIEKIGSGSMNDFSILISDSKIEIHARFIFVYGDIQSPHFRFITTKRNK